MVFIFYLNSYAHTYTHVHIHKL